MITIGSRYLQSEITRTFFGRIRSRQRGAEIIIGHSPPEFGISWWAEAVFQCLHHETRLFSSGGRLRKRGH